MAVFGLYITIFTLIFNGALLWFCYTFVTRDHQKWWLEFFIWSLIGSIPSFFIDWDEPSTSTLVWGVGAILLAYGFLYAVLTFRYSVESPASKVKILGAHFVIMMILAIALSIIM